MIPVLLTVICARQAAGAPDGPDAQGTEVSLSVQTLRRKIRSGRTCEPNLSGTTGADPVDRLPSRSVKYPSSAVVRSGAAEPIGAERLGLLPLP